MQEELNQFERSDLWELVLRPSDQSVTGTKWVFINKVDEHGVIVRNNARLVAQGFNQEEGINYEETFAPIARLDPLECSWHMHVIRILSLIKWMLRVYS